MMLYQTSRRSESEIRSRSRAHEKVRPFVEQIVERILMKSVICHLYNNNNNNTCCNSSSGCDSCRGGGCDGGGCNGSSDRSISISSKSRNSIVV